MESIITSENFPLTDALTNYARGKLDHLVEKLSGGRMTDLHVSMAIENSPQHPGPDVFRCRVQLHGKNIPDVVVTKSSNSMYKAIAMVAKSLHRLLPARQARTRERRRRRDDEARAFSLGYWARAG